MFIEFLTGKKPNNVNKKRRIKEKKSVNKKNRNNNKKENMK